MPKSVVAHIVSAAKACDWNNLSSNSRQKLKASSRESLREEELVGVNEIISGGAVLSREGGTETTRLPVVLR